MNPYSNNLEEEFEEFLDLKWSDNNTEGAERSAEGAKQKCLIRRCTSSMDDDGNIRDGIIIRLKLFQ